VSREVTGYSSVRFSKDLPNADLPSAEREAVPLIADDLGRKVTVLLSEGAW
jgi:hypothetical protein